MREPASLPYVNDLQDAARSLCPSIDDALARCVPRAPTALVSGSGPDRLRRVRRPRTRAGGRRRATRRHRRHPHLRQEAGGGARSISRGSREHQATTYLIAAVVGVTSLSLWAWLILVPAFTRVRALVGACDLASCMSVYVLAAFIAAGGLIAAVFLWYYDRDRVMAAAGDTPATAHDLGALAEVTDAVAAGAGLPEVVRAAVARARRVASCCSTTPAPCSRSRPAPPPTSAR